MAFAVSNITLSTSPAGAACTVTVPSGSNHAALVVVAQRDLTVTGLTCSQGGATVTQHIAPESSPVTGSETRAFRVTGLSAGSATFTPTGSGAGGQCGTSVVVFDDVDQATPLTTGSIEDNQAATVTATIGTANTGMVAVVVRESLATDNTFSSGTLRDGPDGPGGYGSYFAIATRDRAGATTDIVWTNSAGACYTAVAFNPAAGGSARLRPYFITG